MEDNMEFTQLKPENRRAILENEITNYEHQLWARSRDLAHWKLIQTADLSEAAEYDSRIANNRDEECKQQLAGAAYDVVKLQLKLQLTKDELAKLGPST